MSQLEALDLAVESMDLKPEHHAILTMCRGLAEALDAYPARATLWSEYRPALELLLELGELKEDDGQARVLQLLSTPVGDSPEDGSGDARSGGGSGGEDVGPTPDAVAGAGS